MPAIVPVLAQGTAGDTTAPKVAIVNIQEAISTCNEGKKELEALQHRFSPKKNEIDTLGKELDNLQKQYEAQGPKLSDEERLNQAKTIESKKKTLQRNYGDAQTEFQQAEQEIGSRIYQKMAKVLEKLSRQRGYTVVLDVSVPQSPILWAHPATIITKELVDAYNAESPVAVTKTSAPTGTAPRAAGAATSKKP